VLVCNRRRNRLLGEIAVLAGMSAGAQPWGPNQIRSTDTATLPKPGLQGRKTWPEGTFPAGSAPRQRGVRNRFQMSGRLERPKATSKQGKETRN
jgi:hypothetical protein